MKKKVVSRKKKKEEKGVASGLVVPAGIFIGMGLGFLYNHLVAGLFLGMGAGFLLASLFELFKKNK
ncbi:hypothetical protein ISS08_01530 [Candidatus Pacearchaeota archaeon]|nr:hypothetical protein [Candidatus Pacearchaeota archaeon]